LTPAEPRFPAGATAPADWLKKIQSRSMPTERFYSVFRPVGSCGVDAIAAVRQSGGAGQLNLRDEQKMLHLSLKEGKRVDGQLTELANRQVNANALAA
jgi:hypothetical protein